MNKRYLSTQEAAKFLGMSSGTLEVWRCQKKGPKYALLGRRVVYDQIDLEEFVDSRKVFTVDTISN